MFEMAKDNSGNNKNRLPTPPTTANKSNEEKIQEEIYDYTLRQIVRGLVHIGFSNNKIKDIINIYNKYIINKNIQEIDIWKIMACYEMQLK